MSVTSAICESSAVRCCSLESSTTASVRSSRKRSSRRIFRSAYCRTCSGTSMFLPLTIVLTADLQNVDRARPAGRYPVGTHKHLEEPLPRDQYRSPVWQIDLTCFRYPNLNRW